MLVLNASFLHFVMLMFNSLFQEIIYFESYLGCLILF